MARRLERGEVRLYRFARPDKQRPVLILTRTSALRYLSRVTVAPITSSVRGVPSEVALGPDDGMKRECCINLHNLVTVSQVDVGKRLVRLTSDRMDEVCAALGFSLGCDG